MPLSRVFDVVTSRAASCLRLGLARGPICRTGAEQETPGHRLTLYEYEASPWCRLVREHCTHLGLTVTVKPCPRETLRAEGAFSAMSRYRGEALDFINAYGTQDSSKLQFPILVDESLSREKPIVLSESKSIVLHLWQHYGQGMNRPSLDRFLSGNKLPFFVRFASLAGPSGFRPFPRCGLMRTPNTFDPEKHKALELYQSEHCPESRLVREQVSSLEIECVYHVLESRNTGPCATPVLVDPNVSIQSESEVEESDGKGTFRGSLAALSHLHKTYALGPASSISAPVPCPNLGSNDSFISGARRAMQLGGQSGFLPQEF